MCLSQLCKTKFSILGSNLGTSILIYQQSEQTMELLKSFMKARESEHQSKVWKSRDYFVKNFSEHTIWKDNN